MIKISIPIKNEKVPAPAKKPDWLPPLLDPLAPVKDGPGLNKGYDEIQKVLFLSTAHITHDTSLRFGAGDEGEDLPTFYEKDEYGWWVVVPEDGHLSGEYYAPNCPDELKVLLDYARMRGCQWVCLDRDAEKNPNLPTWDW